MDGYLHSFESLAAVDGEGLRCAVFLAGCPLRCIYCHNPDAWELGENKVGAEELVRKIARYKPYFGEKGGVTFSGGEPLLQAQFIEETLPYLEKEEINYAIDTSGAVELTDTVKRVLDGAQLVILDIKFWDDESYLKYTGMDMSKTLEMLEYLDRTNKRTWLRTVVVPGINDSEDVMERYLKYIRKCVKKYELLPFHTMGFFKYEKLGIDNKLADTKDLDREAADKLQQLVNKHIK